MKEYVCIYMSGTMSRDIAKSLMERNVAVRADLIETYPVYMKNGKAKVGTNDTTVMLLVERGRMEEAMGAMESPGGWGGTISAYAFPVLATKGITGS